MSEITIPNRFNPRDYQAELMKYHDSGGTRSVCVWHRRSGKDTVAAHQICKAAHRRRGLYWHMLPTQRQGRKVVWDAFTGDGERLIDRVYPKEIRRKEPNSTEMKIELACGSIVQVVGSDSYDSLVGANPIGVIFSEWSLTDPRAWEFMRPILRENGGWAMFIYTPRGYNHGWDLKEIAEANDDWFYSFRTIDDTHLLNEKDMAAERKDGMQEELINQEYYCDFSAANLGAILGGRLETAEKEGRVTNDDYYDPDGAGVEVSSDIGFRDTAAWWWWQRKPDGIALLHHDSDSGLDASDWITRLEQSPYPISRIWLPHDAKAKTFATKHSALEQFLRAFPGKVKVLPNMRIADRINAARTIFPLCRFNAETCRSGMAALRAWSYVFDPVRKIFSKEPDHDWASHSSDAFTYGAVVMKTHVKPDAEKTVAELVEGEFGKMKGAHYAFNLDQLFADHEARNPGKMRLQ